MGFLDFRTYVIMVIAFSLLKISGAIAVNWLWVFSPVIIYLSLFMILIMVAFGILFFGFDSFSQRYKGNINEIKIDF